MIGDREKEQVIKEGHEVIKRRENLTGKAGLLDNHVIKIVAIKECTAKAHKNSQPFEDTYLPICF